MAVERVKLEVQPREDTGTRAARRFRREGLVPGVLYGRGEPHPFCVPERELRRVLTGSAGTHAILDVTVAGQSESHASILKEAQQDPIKGRLLHIDLHEVRLDRPIQAQVVVELIGEPFGVTDEGGVLSQVVREITVEALPMEVPEHLELDVRGMAIGDTLRLADLGTQEGVTYLDDAEETVLATVTMPTRFVEPEPEEVEGEEELEEGEVPEGEEGEVPEGEEAPGGEGGEEAPSGAEDESGKTEE